MFKNFLAGKTFLKLAKSVDVFKKDGKSFLYLVASEVLKKQRWTARKLKIDTSYEVHFIKTEIKMNQRRWNKGAKIE